MVLLATALLLLGFLAVFAVIAVGVLRLFQNLVQISAAAFSKGSAIDESTRSHQRLAALRASDWEYYRRYLGRQVPQALIDFCSTDRVLALAQFNSNGTDFQLWFEPIAEDGLVDLNDELGYAILPIAATDVGDTIILRPGAKQRNAVNCVHHDYLKDVEEPVEKIASGIEAFLSNLIKA